VNTVRCSGLKLRKNRMMELYLTVMVEANTGNNLYSALQAAASA
jgi:hypothetical protein